MNCEVCGEEIPFSKWKKMCLDCYRENNPRPSKKAKYNPCATCGGEDCACCSYAHGY